MKKFYALTFAAALSLWSPGGLSAQDMQVKALQDYAAADPGEKLFVHLSRTDLITGELLWFSIFQVDRQSHRPLNLSKVVYVELLDQSGSTVLKNRLFIDGGKGYGSLYLPASLQTGNYLFRAYTA